LIYNTIVYVDVDVGLSDLQLSFVVGAKVFKFADK